MGNVFTLNLILLTILLSPDNLSWGKQLEKESISARHPNEPIYSLWISNQNNELPFSLLEAPETQKNFNDAELINSFRIKEIPAGLEIDNDKKSSSPNDVRENNLTFEKDQLRKSNSGYRFHQIPFAEKIFDPSLKIISGLLVGQYKEDDPFIKGLESYKEMDIIKSFSVFLQVQFQF
jgi:hypothetical protein